jgi:hypothetical protein
MQSNDESAITVYAVRMPADQLRFTVAEPITAVARNVVV